MTRPAAAIVGFAGQALSDWEQGFFRELNPAGFILFRRNVADKAQLRRLTQDLRDLLGRDELAILVDQEGGRVQRLGPPIWRKVPPAGVFAALAKQEDLGLALTATKLNARLIARDLKELGITVNCAPVADLLFREAHDIVGDRAYGEEPAQVVAFCEAVIDGFRQEGLQPVIKHIPGHGRAKLDSHLALPLVDAPYEVLCQTDFAVFKALATSPWAMTAHIIYSAIDGQEPATTSQKVIAEVIRGEIGFSGLLLSDDLSMNALSGSIADRAAAALSAGCDIALHCNGKREELLDLSCGLRPLDGAAHRRLQAAASWLTAPTDDDEEVSEERLSAILQKGSLAWA